MTVLDGILLKCSLYMALHASMGTPCDSRVFSMPPCFEKAAALNPAYRLFYIFSCLFLFFLSLSLSVSLSLSRSVHMHIYIYAFEYGYGCTTKCPCVEKSAVCLRPSYPQASQKVETEPCETVTGCVVVGYGV